MFCMNCGKELVGSPEICLSCGARPLAGSGFCPECGAHITPQTEICMRCGTKVGEKGRTRGSTAALTTGGILRVYALKKKRFGLALAGAICSIFATATLCGLGIVLGITAVVLVAISKSKFKKQERESDVLQELR
jgi:predicted amidophosphoribosyltransferase